MTVDFDMRDSEMLLVARHRKSGKWWATVGDAKSDKIREGAEADNPSEALALLLEILATTGVVN